MSSRYDGKPFLRLLESYVLDAIGQLPDEQRVGLAMLEPKLQQVYSMPGDWRQIVAVQMDLPASFADDVQRIWFGFLDSAKAQGIPVQPTAFVERIVSEHFPGIAPDPVPER